MQQNDVTDKLAGIAAQLNELHNTGLAGFSDDALALRFTEKYGAVLRYVAAWAQWYKWTGTHWEQESTLLAFDLARELLRAAAKAANSGGKGIASSTTVNAVISLARTDRKHAATINQWDRDPWLLNTPDGTVNLKTGNMQPHRQEDFITCMTAVAPSSVMSIPIWKAFLATVTGGDEGLEDFLKRVVGYCLTGATVEHALFFLYGLGSNGKSVFLNTIIRILAAYHRVAPMEMLLASKQDRHPTELAGLMGRRLVTSVETEAGRRWAEAKIKNLTGGDHVPARFMRGDFFEYVPTFKLLIAGNHKPSLNRVDEAMRRRFNLVPFTVTIPEGARDPHLAEKLQVEWPGILHWAIEGCLDWQEHRLAAPAGVKAATNEYLASQDTIRNWIAECTAEDVNSEMLASSLFASWKQWCFENNEYAGSMKTFGQRLVDIGTHHRYGNKGALYRGLRLTA